MMREHANYHISFQHVLQQQNDGNVGISIGKHPGILVFRRLDLWVLISYDHHDEHGYGRLRNLVWLCNRDDGPCLDEKDGMHDGLRLVV